MNGVELFFWISLAVVFYTYVGYGFVLYIMVRIKELFVARRVAQLPEPLPPVTLLIAAYNEQSIVDKKMANTLELDYPKHLLEIMWVTDGSNDSTVQRLGRYSAVKVLHRDERMGKSAAINRVMPFVTSSLVIFTDANTMLCPEAVKRIVAQFTDPKVGCVAGEKRVAADQKSEDATAGEGIYWRYESTLKSLDYRLYSAMGAAGELFAIRTPLYIDLGHDTLLDDFVMSMKIVAKGYKIAYCADAYALEEPSDDIAQESKRKVRIAAGGLQSVARLLPLMNIFRYGIVSFQYISHRVLRWTITPLLLFALLPLNIYIVALAGLCNIYGLLLLMQLLFYALALLGWVAARRKVKNKILFIPYYFLFMNVCVFGGISYLRSHSGSGVWEKARRKNG